MVHERGDRRHQLARTGSHFRLALVPATNGRLSPSGRSGEPCRHLGLLQRPRHTAELEVFWRELLSAAPAIGTVLFQDGIGARKLTLENAQPTAGRTVAARTAPRYRWQVLERSACARQCQSWNKTVPIAGAALNNSRQKTSSSAGVRGVGEARDGDRGSPERQDGDSRSFVAGTSANGSGCRCVPIDVVYLLVHEPSGEARWLPQKRRNLRHELNDP